MAYLLVKKRKQYTDGELVKPYMIATTEVYSGLKKKKERDLFQNI